MGLFNRSKSKKLPSKEQAPESGIVRSENGEPVAIYKDRDGTIHKMSAICPHLGCTVYWSGSSKLWECPCHGSQFEPHGAVLQGPADSPLEKKD